VRGPVRGSRRSLMRRWSRACPPVVDEVARRWRVVIDRSLGGVDRPLNPPAENQASSEADLTDAIRGWRWPDQAMEVKVMASDGVVVGRFATSASAGIGSRRVPLWSALVVSTRHVRWQPSDP
jgi:hypothetical protein